MEPYGRRTFEIRRLRIRRVFRVPAHERTDAFRGTSRPVAPADEVDQARDTQVQRRHLRHRFLRGNRGRSRADEVVVCIKKRRSELDFARTTAQQLRLGVPNAVSARG